MHVTFTASARRLGLLSAIWVFSLSLLYALTLIFGFRSLASPEEPIGDPWFSILELLIIGVAPGLVTLMAAVHASAPRRAKILSLSALIFMAMAMTLTVSVHFVILVVARSADIPGEPWASMLLSFRWPSLPYLIDILAWDLFFALSMILAAPALQGDRLARVIRMR
jgi:hypothetical protein